MYHKCIPLVEVNICLLADEIGIPTTNTFDFSQGVHDFALSIYIGVEETKNVLQREFWMREKKKSKDNLPEIVDVAREQQGTSLTFLQVLSTPSASGINIEMNPSSPKLLSSSDFDIHHRERGSEDH